MKRGRTLSSDDSEDEQHAKKSRSSSLEENQLWSINNEDPYAKLPCHETGSHNLKNDWVNKLVKCTTCEGEFGSITREICIGVAKPNAEKKNHFLITDNKSGSIYCEDCGFIIQGQIVLQDSIDSEGNRY